MVLAMKVKPRCSLKCLRVNTQVSATWEKQQDSIQLWPPKISRFSKVTAQAALIIWLTLSTTKNWTFKIRLRKDTRQPGKCLKPRKSKCRPKYYWSLKRVVAIRRGSKGRWCNKANPTFCSRRHKPTARLEPCTTHSSLRRQLSSHSMRAATVKRIKRSWAAS